MIGPTTINLIRSRYQEIWKSDWPHPDWYLDQLAVEAKFELGFSPRAKIRNSQRVKAKDIFFKILLDAMRSDDPSPIVVGKTRQDTKSA